MKKSVVCLSFVALSCLFSVGCAKKTNVAEVLDTPAAPQEVAVVDQSAATRGDRGSLQVGNAEMGMKSIYFGFDSYALSEESKDVLRQNAEWMKANPTAKIIIEGHTDERGSDAYNLALGDNRARSTANYLVSLGIAEARINTISYGEERPAVMGQGEAVWSKNRRAEFL